MKNIVLVLSILVIFGFTKDEEPNKPERNKRLPKTFVAIPQGKYLEALVDGDSTVGVKSTTIPKFYIAEIETTNAEYKAFIIDLKRNGLEFEHLLPDTSVWRRVTNSFNEVLVRQYYQHPKFNNYPVVGLSREQVKAYIKWLNDSEKDTLVSYSLPTNAQWKRAARGATLEPYTSNFDGCNHKFNYRLTYGSGISLNNETGEYELKGSLESNFFADGALFTSDGHSYEPNKFGLYNMCGNVAEMIADKEVALGGSWYDPGYDVRIDSERSTKDPNAFVGFRVVASIYE